MLEEEKLEKLGRAIMLKHCLESLWKGKWLINHLKLKGTSEFRMKKLLDLLMLVILLMLQGQFQENGNDKDQIVRG